MIKSLFGEEEDPKKSDSKQSASISIFAVDEETDNPEPKKNEPPTPVEDSKQSPAVNTEAVEADDAPSADERVAELERMIAEIENEHKEETNRESITDSPPSQDSPPELEIEDLPGFVEKQENRAPETEFLKEVSDPTPRKAESTEVAPESKAEAIRNSGLAYSAAIALFGSVVFMLIMGWFADLLLGIRPWGTIIGIVIGAIIGFMQLFRLTSQIINPKPNDFDKVSLRTADADLPEVSSNETIADRPSDAEMPVENQPASDVQQNDNTISTKSQKDTPDDSQSADEMTSPELAESDPKIV